MALCVACGEKNPERAKFCLGCGAPLAETAAARAEVRKTVTVVFADVTGSTQLGERLDPESVRRLMSRYFEEMRAVIERHGGTVEKFIGDAVMAVFGVPVLHEDDALRAVRAAAEMRNASAALNEDFRRDRGVAIQLRIGVNTGEVVVGDSSEGQPFATGDAVNVAARLEQAAAPGEILIGEATRTLAGDTIRAERTDPLTLKGKSGPVAAWRLVDVLPDVPAFTREIATPFVGREGDLETLVRALERAREERACELCTVVGPPGIGKSRLARELVAAASGRARIVVGRCIPYGQGITFWPLGEIVRQLDGADPRARLRELLKDEERPELIADRISAAIGLGAGHGQAEETFWAFRKLFEALGRAEPVLAVVDDIHWAEPTLLDLLEYLVSFASDSAILILCLARADLFDGRPSWAAPRRQTSLVTLAPLSETDAETLVEELAEARGLSRGVREQVIEAAEGNPLFVEQMIALRTTDGESDVTVPPTIEALLAARIDRLPSDERAVLERAAIEGRGFHRGAVAALLPAEMRPRLDAHLMSLVRKEFIRPDRALFRADDGFRFVHVLVRDAAYQSISKYQRAELHEGFAEWLERAAADRLVEYEEILGYHLEQAYRYREQLGPVDDAARALGRRAAERLVAAGKRAVARRDLSSSESLLTRACALLEDDDPLRLEALLELSDSVLDAGDLDRGAVLLAEVVERAERTANEVIAGHARLRSALAGVHAGQSDEADLVREAEAAIALFTRLGDERGLAHAWAVLGRVRFWLTRAGEAEDAYRRAVELARRSGDRHRETETLAWWIGAKAYGPAPVPEGIDFCDEILDRGLDDPVLDIFALEKRGMLEALSGRLDDARSSVREARALAEELGLKVRSGMNADYTGLVELLAGDLDAAEREFRAGYELLGSIGENAFRSALALSLSEVLYRQGRYEEALAFLDPDDVTVGARRGKILARLGDPAESERRARLAVESWEGSDYLVDRANALMDLAEVLRLAGRPEESSRVVADALRLYDQKGSLLLADRARSILRDYPPSSADWASASAPRTPARGPSAGGVM